MSKYNKSLKDVYVELCELWDNQSLYNFVDPNFVSNKEQELISNFSSPTHILQMFKDEYLKKHQ